MPRRFASSQPSSPATACRGDTVYVRLEGGELAASVGTGAPRRRGQTALLLGGSLDVYASKPGSSRRVDIIKPGVDIRVTQPWIKTGDGGYYAQQ